MPCAIRSAHPDDAADIARLLTELGYPQVTPVRPRLESWLARQEGAVLVAERAGAPAGLLGVVAVHAVPHFARDGLFARIVALVVGEAARGTGVGRALVAAAEEQARALGCLEIEVGSSRRRHGAHAFYRRLGYEETSARSGRFLRVLG